jgi:predicted small lipoprotein YifL
MRALISLIALAALLAACGYKGPLYLPKPKPEAQKPAPPPAPQQDDKKPPRTGTEPPMNADGRR